MNCLKKKIPIAKLIFHPRIQSELKCLLKTYMYLLPKRSTLLEIEHVPLLKMRLNRNVKSFNRWNNFIFEKC